MKWKRLSLEFGLAQNEPFSLLDCKICDHRPPTSIALRKFILLHFSLQSTAEVWCAHTLAMKRWGMSGCVSPWFHVSLSTRDRSIFFFEIWNFDLVANIRSKHANNFNLSCQLLKRRQENPYIASFVAKDVKFVVFKTTYTPRLSYTLAFSILLRTCCFEEGWDSGLARAQIADKSYS